MNTVRPRTTAAFLVALLIFNPLFAWVPARAQTFTAPWTQEKVKPPEVQDKDKKKEQPLAWCTRAKWRKGVRVRDGNGDPVSEDDVTYADGTQVHYEYSKGGPVKWVVTLPGGKKITYDPTNQTQTTEEPGKQPVTKEWKEAKDAADAAKKSAPGGGTPNPPPAPGSNPPKKGSWLLPSDSRLARVAYQTYSPIPPASREIPADFPPSPLQLAATGDQPTSPASQGQGKVVIINLKIVTYGNPPADTIGLFDPGPQTTPEQFLDTPTPVTWDPKTDGEGPKTTRPGPTGIPVTEIPGGGIYIGWGWTSGWVSESTIEECGDVQDKDLQEAKRLTDLATKAKEGGPEYWRTRAKTGDNNARTADNQPGRERAAIAARERAKQDRATADELEKHGVPDKPDPKLPKAQRDQVDKERADAIKKIVDEAEELTRKASTK